MSSNLLVLAPALSNESWYSIIRPLSTLNILGIDEPAPIQNMQIAKTRIYDELSENNVMDSDGKLTKIYQILARSLNEYVNVTEYFKLGDFYLSDNGSDEVILLSPFENKFKVLPCSKKYAISLLLSVYTNLKDIVFKEEIRYPNEKELIEIYDSAKKENAEVIELQKIKLFSESYKPDLLIIIEDKLYFYSNKDNIYLRISREIALIKISEFLNLDLDFEKAIDEIMKEI